MTTETEIQTETTEATQKTLCKLKITEIDRTLKTRSEVREPVAKEYSELIKGKVKLPPPIVFEHDGTFYLSSGFHRVRAAEILELEEVECEVRTGDRLQAISFGCLANKKQNGERLTMADRNAAVRLVLGLYPNLSDGSIAHSCGVDHKTVAARRYELVATREIPELTDRVGLDGKTRRVPPPRPAAAAPQLDTAQDDSQAASQEGNEADSGPSATLAARTVEEIADIVSVDESQPVELTPEQVAARKTKFMKDAHEFLGKFDNRMDSYGKYDPACKRDTRELSDRISRRLEQAENAPHAQTEHTKESLILDCNTDLDRVVLNLDRLKRHNHAKAAKAVLLVRDIRELLTAVKNEGEVNF